MPKKFKKPLKTNPKTSQTKYSPTTTISVCMIVKDEEQLLDNCIKSVKGIADEIIIIDTGSKDKTVDIAKRYTDKVYFHPWQNSFSEARNHYFEYATGDWIFQIDADEELVQKDTRTLLEAVKNPEIDAIRVQIISTYKKGEDESRHNAERIFRNNGIIHYEGRVHNRLVGIKRPQIYSIGLLHYGYDLDDVELTEKKHQRRVELLKQDIMDDPENPLPYHYLGCCYLPRGQYHETLDVSLKAIELADKQKDVNPIYLWSRYNAAMAYYQLQDYKNAELISLEVLKNNDRHIDSYFILTLVNHENKKWDEVIKYGQKYAELCELFKKDPDKFGILVSSTLGMDWNILVLMGIASYETGKEKKAEELFRKAAKKTKKSFQVFRAAGLYFNNKRDHQKAKIYLEKAHKINPDDSTTGDILEKLRTKKPAKKTISCCMIVKNEEEFLEKCLASVKDYVDELIIVDTGSTDSTVDIAKKYTDKIYFHPWENSFSKARNQALSYATGDWVFQIDGDEELMEGSGELLRKTVQEAVNEDVINVKLLCSYSDGAKTSMHYFERIFRNNGIIHYEGRVHNRIVGYKSPRYSRIELWHYGYDVEEDKAQQKFERTTGLLKKDIEDDPQNPLPHHYLSSSYLSKNMFKEALKEAELAIQLTERLENRDHIYAWTYYNASMSLFRLGEHEKAIEYSLRALRIYPDNLDSYYMLTIITGEKTEWEAVCKYGENYIRVWRELKDNPEKAEMSINTTISEAPAIYMLLGHAHHADKAYREMDECYSRACDTANEKWQVFWNIGAYHLDKSGDMDLAEKYLNLSKLEAPDEHNVWYMLAKYHNKCGNKNDEISTLEKVIEIGTEEDFIYNRLLTLYAEKEMNDKALFLLSSMEKIDISLYSHLLKLGNSYIETGNLELAFQCYTKAAESKPNSPEAWSILSEITYSLGKFEDSKVFAEKALEFNENDLSNLLTMCDLTLKLGDIESHINYCDKILDNLNLNRSRTLEGFNDLKEVFIEINDSTGNINSLKINSIINQLDSYISPSA